MTRTNRPEAALAPLALLIGCEVLGTLREALAEKVPELERAYDSLSRGILRRFDTAQRRPAVVS